MANIKITDLTELNDPDSTDVLPIVDVGADVTKKVTVGEVVGKISGDVDVATDGTSSIASGAIVNGDINASAAIAGTKIDPDFGSQTVETTGDLAINTNVLFVDSSESAVGIGTTSPSNLLHVSGTSDFVVDTDDSTARFGSYGEYDIALVTGRNTPTGSSRVYIENADGEAARIDSSGRLLVGTSSSTAFATSNPALQIVGDDFSNSTIGLRRSVEGTNGPSVLFACSNGTVASPTIVADDDELAKFRFYGYDGDSFDSFAAEISVFVDGTPGVNDMPGRLVFSTTADGASSPTERMRISRNGDVTISCSTYSSINSATTSSSVEVLRLTTQASNSSNNKIIQILSSGGQGRGILYSGNSVSQAAYLAAASDRRLKTNIREYTDGYEKIKSIPVKIFDEIDGKKDIAGWIADEVQQVIPSAVNGEPNAVDEQGNPIYQSLGATNFIPDIVQALQAAITKIELLEAKVADLEAS